MGKRRSRDNAQWLLLDKPKPGEGRVIGQVRYSSRMQDMRSIVEQQENITRAAHAEAWEVIGWREEPEQTARYDELERRPEFVRLLTEDAGVTCNVIMCDETSRWSRSSTGDIALKMLRERRCWWQTADGEWDINKPLTDGGAIMWALAQGMNADFLRKLSKHTKKGKRAKARDGYSNGTPMFGYRIPDIVVPAEIRGTKEERTLRRRIVYEPHPEYFPALVRLGELLAQVPRLKLTMMADMLNDEGFSYKTRGIVQRWTPKIIQNMIRMTYQREFGPGCGHGTIYVPDGEKCEGLHAPAWSFEICERIDERTESILATHVSPGSPPAIHTFSGLISCYQCGTKMLVHNVKKIDLHRKYVYYSCKVNAWMDGKSSKNDHTINTAVVDHQFGDLLHLIGGCAPEAIEKLRAHYLALGSETADPVIDYEKRRAHLEQQEKRTLDQHRKGYIDDDELDRVMAQIRREKLHLPRPIRRDDELDQRMGRIRQIMSLAEQWEYLGASHDQRTRRMIAESLLAPNGLIYDTANEQIAAIRPRPGLVQDVALVLSDHQWVEEDGVITNQARMPMLFSWREVRYPQIMRLLQEGPKTAPQLAQRLGLKRMDIHWVLARMMEQGVVIRYPAGTTYEYEWVGPVDPPQQIPSHLGITHERSS